MTSWLSQTLIEEFGLTEITARHLAQKYGACAPDMLSLVKKEPDLAQPLVGRARSPTSGGGVCSAQ